MSAVMTKQEAVAEIIGAANTLVYGAEDRDTALAAVMHRMRPALDVLHQYRGTEQQRAALKKANERRAAVARLIADVEGDPADTTEQRRRQGVAVVLDLLEHVDRFPDPAAARVDRLLAAVARLQGKTAGLWLAQIGATKTGVKVRDLSPRQRVELAALLRAWAAASNAAADRAAARAEA